MIGYESSKQRKLAAGPILPAAWREGVPVVLPMGVKGANNHSMEGMRWRDTVFQSETGVGFPSYVLTDIERDKKKI